MTAFAASQIPSQINTLEKLHVWTSYCLRQLNPSVKQLETELVKDFKCSNVQVTLDDGTQANIDRIVIPLVNDYGTNGTKLWVNARELSVIDLTTAMTTN